MAKATEEKILTLSPDPSKKGVNIAKDRYDFIKAAILQVLKDQGSLSSGKLVEAVVKYIEDMGGVDYSIGWYTMAIKLDLEARGEILYNRDDRKPVISLP